MPRMMGLPPKISGFTVMRPRSVSSITMLVAFVVRRSERFVRQDICRLKEARRSRYRVRDKPSLKTLGFTGFKSRLNKAFLGAPKIGALSASKAYTRVEIAVLSSLLALLVDTGSEASTS